MNPSPRLHVPSGAGFFGASGINSCRQLITQACRKDTDDALNIEHVETSVVEDVRVSGNLAVARGRDTGTTTSRKGGKPVPYDLKWVMAFERQADRTWKCCYEIWCENPLEHASRIAG